MELLSHRAVRLFRLLTPQPVPIDERYVDMPAVQELIGLGLVEKVWLGGRYALKLTSEGGRRSPSVN